MYGNTTMKPLCAINICLLKKINLEFCSGRGEAGEPSALPQCSQTPPSSKARFWREELGRPSDLLDLSAECWVQSAPQQPHAAGRKLWRLSTSSTEAGSSQFLLKSKGDAAYSSPQRMGPLTTVPLHGPSSLVHKLVSWSMSDLSLFHDCLMWISPTLPL
jgi:hypothetical protein